MQSSYGEAGLSLRREKIFGGGERRGLSAEGGLKPGDRPEAHYR